MRPTPHVDDVDFAEAFGPMVERAFRAAAPILRQWYSEHVLRESLARELRDDLHATAARRDDAGNSTASHRRADAVHLVQLEADPARWIVVHLHRAEDPDHGSLVIVKHRSFDVRDETDLEAIRAATAAAFPGERDRKIGVLRFTSGECDPSLASRPVLTNVVSGLIRDVHLPESSDAPPGMSLVSPREINFYDAYESWYREFWRMRPELTAQVPIETRDDLQQCVDDDGLRLIYHDADLCGLIAAMRDVEFGLKGWRMCEKVIAPAFWGRGLAAPATVQFAQSLPHQPDDALWGTIVPGNHASLRSAETTGRRVIGSLHVV